MHYRALFGTPFKCTYNNSSFVDSLVTVPFATFSSCFVFNDFIVSEARRCTRILFAVFCGKLNKVKVCRAKSVCSARRYDVTWLGLEKPGRKQKCWKIDHKSGAEMVVAKSERMKNNENGVTWYRKVITVFRLLTSFFYI